MFILLHLLKQPIYNINIMESCITNILKDSKTSRYIDNNCQSNLKKRWNAVNLTYGRRYGFWSKLAGLLRRVFNIALACIGCSDWQRANRATVQALKGRISGIHPKLKGKKTVELSQKFSRVILYTLVEGTKIYSKNPEKRLNRWNALKEKSIYTWMDRNLPSEPKPKKPEPKKPETVILQKSSTAPIDDQPEINIESVPPKQEKPTPEDKKPEIPPVSTHDDKPETKLGFSSPKLKRWQAYSQLPSFNPNPEPLPDERELDLRVNDLMTPFDYDDGFDSGEDYTDYSVDDIDDTVFDEEFAELQEEEPAPLHPGVPESTVYTFKYDKKEFGTQRDHTYQVFKNLVPIVEKRAQLLRDDYHFTMPKDNDSDLYTRGYDLLQKENELKLEELNKFMLEAKAKIGEIGDEETPSPLYTSLTQMVEIFYLERMSLLAKDYQQGIHVHRKDFIDAKADPEHYRGWVGSQDTRDILSLADFKHKDLDEAVREYEFFADLLMAAPSNFRDHITKANGGSDHLLRLGVVSFMANAYTNLKELKEMADDEQLLVRKVKALNKSLKSADKTQKITIRYALNQLRSPHELQRAINERRTYLQLQMLQLIHEQLKNTDGKIGPTFNMMHLLLLTENNKAMDPDNNWYKHEGNFMMDMAEIFNEFEGATILFKTGAAAPYIREIEGEKHLYFPYIDGAPEKTTLQPAFINLAVQLRAGYKKELKQRAIFSQWLVKVKKYSGQQGEDAELKGLIRRFANGESDYSLGRDIIIYARNKGFRCSTGCMSAKDRTGVLCDENAIIFTLEQHDLDKKSPHRTEWGKGMLKSGRPALEIAKQCGQAQREPIKVNGLKVLSPNLCSLTAGTKGKLNRFYGYLKMIPV